MASTLIVSERQPNWSRGFEGTAEVIPESLFAWVHRRSVPKPLLNIPAHKSASRVYHGLQHRHRRQGWWTRKWWTVVIISWLISSEPIAAFGKPKMVVTLYAEEVHFVVVLEQVVTVYVVLPDGSKVMGDCVTNPYSDRRCLIRSFAPEKRNGVDCIDSAYTIQAKCYTNDVYYADRKGDELKIHGYGGTVTYTITGSWSKFELGHLEPHP